MIEFYSENNFSLEKESEISSWISEVIDSHSCSEGDITFVFCDDAYLHKLNVQFLNHDTFTDIISFDTSLGSQIHGEIYISTQRVAENAITYNSGLLNELHRVIIHGVLHFCGFKDKTDQEAIAMRAAEETALERRTFL